MNDDKYLRIKQVTERTGLSRATIYNMMNDGTFPNKTALGERAVAWLESEIIQWMETRKTVEKTGLEAKPGCPPKKKISLSAHAENLPSITAPSKQKTQQATLAKIVTEGNDWGQNDPPLSDAEMDGIRFSRLIANQSRKLTGTPLKGRTRHVEILPTGTEKKKIVTVSSSRGIFSQCKADTKTPEDQ